MLCASALSTDPESEAAIREVVERLGEAFAETPADLAVVFVSMHHAEHLGRLTEALAERGLGRHVLGCTGESIVGEAREIENGPAMAAWAISLPGAEFRPIRIDGADDGVEALRGHPPGDSTVLLLGDPFTFPTDAWLKKAGEAAPGLRVVGGMASGSHAPGENRLVLDRRLFHDGAVAIEISGPIAVRTLVSQGCRPVGRPMIVTKVERNLIRELGRRPALEALREIFEGLGEADRERVQAGLHIGRVINEYQEHFGPGDFLIRNVMGADDAGGIAISDVVRVGQTIQFQVRDAETADEDLRRLIEQEREARPDARISGALLFTCNGRGSRLFSVPDHDVGVLRELLGPIPVAGLFAMGEIGPIGGQNFVHGFTASIVLFEEPADWPARRA
ncbi:FIST signal transduction protein [Tundrisphaera sp. TA3]|uniref:FIST signal transduction protein n=1 Tax=Tundrisphaera sp. TA3 TaxID=3435775 RepID=UPI003EC037C9